MTHLVVHTTYNGTDCGQGLPPEHVAHVQMPQELLTQFWGRHSITIAWSSQRRVLPGRRSSRRSEGGEKSQEVPHPLVVGLAAQVAHQVAHLQLLRAAHSTHTSRGRHYTSSLTTLTLEAVEKMVLMVSSKSAGGFSSGISTRLMHPWNVVCSSLCACT